MNLMGQDVAVALSEDLDVLLGNYYIARAGHRRTIGAGHPRTAPPNAS